MKAGVVCGLHVACHLLNDSMAFFRRLFSCRQLFLQHSMKACPVSWSFLWQSLSAIFGYHVLAITEEMLFLALVLFNLGKAKVLLTRFLVHQLPVNVWLFYLVLFLLLRLSSVHLKKLHQPLNQIF